MSTKIYHGYRLTAGTDLFDFTDKLRAAMNPIRDRLDARMLMGMAVSAVDRADSRGEARPWFPLYDAMSAHDADQASRKPADRGHDPNRFEVAFAADNKPGGTGRILALLYTDHDVFTAAWRNLPEVEPFGYWNNTDAPDEVSEADWDARRAAWNRVLPDYDAPIRHTLGFALRSESHDPGLIDLVSNRDEPATRELLLAGAPTLRHRARNVAVAAVLAEARRRDEDVDSVRVVTQFMFSGRARAKAVIDAAAPTLNTDVVDYVLTGSHPTGQPTCPLDLTGVQAAAAAYLDAVAAPAAEDN